MTWSVIGFQGLPLIPVGGLLRKTLPRLTLAQDASGVAVGSADGVTTQEIVGKHQPSVAGVVRTHNLLGRHVTHASWLLAAGLGR